MQVGAAEDSPAYPAYAGESRGYEGEPELEEPDLRIDTQAAVCGVGGVGGAVVPGPLPVVPVANSLDATRETGNMCNIYIYVYMYIYTYDIYVYIYIYIYIYIHIYYTYMYIALCCY